MFEPSVRISAKLRLHIDKLVDTIKKSVFNDFKTDQFLIPYDAGSVVSYFNEHANILETDYTAEGTLLTVECQVSDADRFAQYIVK